MLPKHFEILFESVPVNILSFLLCINNNVYLFVKTET